MAFIPIPQSVQLCFDFVTAGQNWQVCIVAKKLSGSPSGADLAALALAGYNWWSADGRDLLSNEVTLRQARATDMTSQGAPVAIEVSGDAGTVAQPSLPLGSALVTSLRTALRGRSYRGRQYWSGIPITAQDDPTNVTSTFATALGTAIGQLLSDIAALGFDAVIASKQHNGAVTNPAATNEITDVIVDTKLDSQRRRLEGRGT